MAIQRELLGEQQGFSNVTTGTLAGFKMVFVAGQVGRRAGETEAPEDLREQAIIAFENVVAQLSEAGATPEDIFKINVYITDIDAARTREVGIGQVKVFGAVPMPAATWVGVTGLVHPSYQVEVEATALVAAD